MGKSAEMLWCSCYIHCSTEPETLVCLSRVWQTASCFKFILTCVMLQLLKLLTSQDGAGTAPFEASLGLRYSFLREILQGACRALVWYNNRIE